MREKMQRFMMGRYGTDELVKLSTGAALILLILSMFGKLSFLYIVALGLLIYSYFRMFSKNVSKRYEENQKFLNFRYQFTVKRNNAKKRFAQRGMYRFYKCPQCKQRVRVPKGKGKICITCPKCRNEFVKRS